MNIRRFLTKYYGDHRGFQSDSKPAKCFDFLEKKLSGQQGFRLRTGIFIGKPMNEGR
jgi:hypothetical protein